MKRCGWVLAVVLGCGQSSNPLPVEQPKPLGEWKPVAEPTPPPLPDAGVADAAPDPAAIAQAAHEKCEGHKKQSEADLPPVPAPKKSGTPKAAVFLAGAGDPKERYEHATFIEGPWNGESTRKKLATKIGPLTACYAEALKRDPSINGGITLGATLNENGSLTDVRIIEQTTADEALQTCVQTQFGTLKIPGGSKDAHGFEAYWDLVFCPADRGVCVVGLDAKATWWNKLRPAIEDQTERMAACYRAAGKSHARGVLEVKSSIARDGGRSRSDAQVVPFSGDDKQATAWQAASECEGAAWSVICINPPPLDETPEYSVRLWFQR